MRRGAIRRVAAVTAIGVMSLAAAAAAQPQAPAKIDVTGAWAFEVQTEAGTGTPLVTFKQDGERLTGHYSSSVLGEAELEGTLKGAAIEFTVEPVTPGMFSCNSGSWKKRPSFRAAMRKSAANAMKQPRPTADPWICMTTGFFM